MLLGFNAIFTLLDMILDRILYHLVSQFCECHMPKAMRAWTPRGVLWDLLSRGSVVASLHLTRFTQANVTVQDAMLSQGAKALLNCAMTWTFRHCETLPATRSGIFGTTGSWSHQSNAHKATAVESSCLGFNAQGSSLQVLLCRISWLRNGRVHFKGELQRNKRFQVLPSLWALHNNVTTHYPVGNLRLIIRNYQRWKSWS